MSMYCNQCQETAKNTACTVGGVCGKTEEVANLQDLLIWLLEGISYWADKARKAGHVDHETDLFVAKGLFTTITNVNFDAQRMTDLVKECLKRRDALKAACKPSSCCCSCGCDEIEAASWEWDGTKETLNKKAAEVGLHAEKNEDIRSLKSLVLFGLKGVAAYTDHAYILGAKDDAILHFMQEALLVIASDAGADTLLDYVMKTGEYSVKAMALLDKANTDHYGKQEITAVSTGTKKGPGILVSGHDLLDLEELLKQTEGAGINIYTHGEMLPANAYPGLKKYKHLAGNFGTSWYNQQKEFEEFKGAILMTTNCIVKPRDSYKDRIFTTGLVGFPGVAHIQDRAAGKQKDFSALIKKALACGSLDEKTGKPLTIGFSHHTVLGLADKVIGAIKAGAVKRLVVMSGCDGRHKEREYFTAVAAMLPKDTIILTSGCAKYRYNSLDLGDIGGIPRVLDAGQCNDSYSWAFVALKLKEALGLKDVNELPVSFDVGWYEQKAVCVLLALLYLGFKNIYLGPTLPGFLSPNILKAVAQKFNIKPVSTAEKDAPLLAAGR